ncbi:hypothetical protein SAMN05421678_108235 [Actinopolymorpha cephalotaxi]|uniref:Uncharacterized protein n=1 Tax=Actinopolymorpha cephalotaxi TaxID=504797 RepID=A0A1I2UQU8_9ACTN|nr:hypothetical protein [Actinopolymorpha cephalotaxi]NYH86649.1 hypothetical protein [Actinopolymorpha cephalotaxi]SFG78077.1 hypothetical protein SAMN05421678_108235 [Actinopolymorpha cephalotaxi]
MPLSQKARQKRSAIGNATLTGNREAERIARQEYEAAKLEDDAARIIEGWPKLTEEQRDTIRRIFRPIVRADGERRAAG